MITERTLRKWRKEALMKTTIPDNVDFVTILAFENEDLRGRVLKMTQELLDQHLIRKEEK